MRDRGPAAVAAGYLAVIDGRYQRTPLGDEYVLAALDQRADKSSGSEGSKARARARYREDLAEQAARRTTEGVQP